MAFDLVLASGSPRRRELLGRFGVPFRIIATDAEEQEHAPESIVAQLPPLDLPLHDHPTLRAWRKADAVQAQAPNSTILAADTIVVADRAVLNKPESVDHAIMMLQQLSGRPHTVYTGVVLIDPAIGTHLELVASQVWVAAIDETTIRSYVATREPLDKAGSYGIQGLGGQLVQSVEGSYTNVVGLPVVTVQHLLAKAGIAAAVDPEALYYAWLRDQGKEPMSCPPTFP
jgi:septum formation protein